MTVLNWPSARASFGVTNALVALLTLIGVFAGLPTRWPWVDVPAVLLSLVLFAAAAACFVWRVWSPRVVAVAAGVVLVLGLLVVALLSLAASFLAGVIGAVGSGGMTLFLMVLALVFPYLVAYPALQLVWALRQGAAGRAP